MARWQPGARERLSQAAMELFVEQSYDRTSVAEITDRAGLTRRTFFRYFGDKREVIFAERALLGERMSAAIQAAPEGTPVWETVALAVESVGEIFPAERRDFVRTRQAAVASAPELLERELLKRQALTDTLAAALEARGVVPEAATVAAGLAVLCLRQSIGEWATGTRDFAVVARHQHRALREVLAAGLTQPLTAPAETPDSTSPES
ncbi:TetR family transcriptional regulator [Flexivirga sp. ID2601S]|uniref:TetR family transcriptional regulator n=1 Tax=Flexivirga aerilata TaxID=1656889 RepID=A0A849AJ50_9MICO|nr:TetR family transcriptional regulator [Flexivirga aerilata]NNG40455.1 TetR family transcriptional regulator [Flexivirga aerilata]